MTQLTNKFEYKGVAIRQWDEMLSLTDMWRAAGSESERRPGDWIVTKDAIRFIDAVKEVLNAAGGGINDLVVTERGKGGGTRAHWQIGLAYAKYVSPEFHMWCNTVVRAVMEGKVAPTGPKVTLRDVGGVVKSITSKAMAELAAQVAEMNAASEKRIADELAASEKRMADELAASDKRNAEERVAFEAKVENIAHKYDPNRTVSVDFHIANWYVIRAGVAEKGRRGFSLKCRNRMLKFAGLEIPGEPGKNRLHLVSTSNETGKWTFHHLLWREWVIVEGDALMRAHKDAQDGQSVLRLVSPSKKS